MSPGGLVRRPGCALIGTPRSLLLMPALVLVTATTGLRLTGSVVKNALGGAADAVRTKPSLHVPVAAVVAPEPDLRRRGDALLRQIDDPVELHETPAFERILQEISGDEARILRLVANAGPQAMLDVRTRQTLGGTSELVLSNMNVVAEAAGCTFPSRGQRYLANLGRLGLLHASDDPVGDLARYVPVENLPEVANALTTVRRAGAVRRSIALTNFGRRFTEACFTLGG